MFYRRDPPPKTSPVYEELNEEIMIESSLAGNSSSVASLTIALDPTLTMDLTTMNPPGGHGDNDGGAPTSVAAGGGDAAGGTSTAEDDVAGSTKEAASPPSKMDTEPERTHGDAPEANETHAATAGDASDDDDDDVVTEEARSGEDGGGDGAVANASKPTSPVTEGESTASPPPKSPAAKDVAKTLAPSQDRTTTTSSPTLAPTMVVAPAKILMTSSPTVEYVKPGDDSLDPVGNEKDAENESFEDGEATPSKHDNSDDDEMGSKSGGLDDWDEDYDGKLSKDEEEEVKKVGGWLSFASIVLMIYTAYQMSENPDGICAR